VGGKAQPKLVRALAGSLKNRYAQFLELETFARFGTRLEASAQAVVDWGRRARAVIHQGHGRSQRWAETVARMLLVDDPRFVELPQDRVVELIDQGVAELLAEPGFDAAGIDGARIGPKAVESLRKHGAAVMQRLLEPEQEPSA